jgi:hypothetical protein
MSKNTKKQNVKNVGIIENAEEQKVVSPVETTDAQVASEQVEEINPEEQACKFAAERYGIAPEIVLAILDTFKVNQAKRRSNGRTIGSNGPSLMSEALRVLKSKMAEGGLAAQIGMNCPQIIDVLREDEVGKTLSCFHGTGKDGREKTPAHYLYGCFFQTLKKQGEASPVQKSDVKGYWKIKQ